MVRDIVTDHHIGPNFDVVAYANPAEQLGPRGNGHVVTDGRGAVFLAIARPPDGDTVREGAGRPDPCAAGHKDPAEALDVAPRPDLRSPPDLDAPLVRMR